ncbi:MAG: BrnT family toxin [Sphingomonadaceae bacterium]
MFEYDPAKSAANLAKHGIDFEAAQALWTDADRIKGPARSEGEPRWMVIGKIGRIVWAAAITYRGDKIRIISVRRAREKELASYGNAQNLSD